MKGAYVRAAIKAEIKRAKARGETIIRGSYLQEIGLAPAEHQQAVGIALAELKNPPAEHHGPSNEGGRIGH